MSSQSEQQRSIMLVQKSFQVDFIVKLTGLIIAGCGLGGFVLHVVTTLILSAPSVGVERIPPATRHDLLLTIVVVQAMVVLLVSAAAGWLSIVTFHRVVGPLTRFERVVREVADGRLRTVASLREGDELQAFPAALGSLVNQLTERFGALATAHSGLRSELELLAASGSISEDHGGFRYLRDAENVVADLHKADEG